MLARAPLAILVAFLLLATSVLACTGESTLTPSAVSTPTPTAVSTPTPTAVSTPTPTAVSTPTPTVVLTPTPVLNTLRLEPSRDATLYEHKSGKTANSTGSTNFVGTTNRGERRRMLIAFDLSSLPTNYKIIGARLEVRMSKSASGPAEVSLHRVTSAWREGDSKASGMGGKGTTASAGDPTWVHATYPDTRWSNAGGDFLAEASAVTTVDNETQHSWSGPGLLEDVNLWANDATANLGWLAIGDEAHQKTAKRFDAREHVDLERRPRLVIELTSFP